MNRWRSLALVAIVVATAGCGSHPLGNGATGVTEATGVTGSPTATETELPVGGTRTPTEAGPHTVPADDRLVVRKVIRENVTISMYEENVSSRPTTASSGADRAEPIASVTYGPEETGEVGVTTFEPDGYVVISTDGRTLWQSWIEPYEYIELYIHTDGEVEVTEHAVL